MQEQLGFEFPPSEATTASGRDSFAIDRHRKDEVGSHLLDWLADVARRYPRERKLVVGRTRGEVHEILRQLARARAPWIGFEATTVRPLAIELAGPVLAAGRISLLDEFQELALMDDAIDRVLLPDPPDRFARLADSVGFRDALKQSLRALRLVGIKPERMHRARVSDPDKIRVVAEVLDAYEARLRADRRGDHATVLASAVAVLEEARSGRASSPLADRKVFLLPGLHLRGLAGELVRLLGELGGATAVTDPVAGLDPPRATLWTAGPARSGTSFLHSPAAAPEVASEFLQLFAAGSIDDELREVLRRIIASGRRWDEAEIVATDPQAYGSALHALAERLEIPVTYAVGLPVERTRPGRAVAAYFRWLDGGFEADVVRRLLEAGDLRPPGRGARLHEVPLARRFRALRIGWGRDRYLPALERGLAAARGSEARAAYGSGKPGRGPQKSRLELEALESILAPILRRVPPVPDGPEQEAASVSPAAIARGLVAFLRFVPARNDVDATAKDRIERILSRVAATLTRETGYGAAAAVLKAHLQIRVPAPRAEGRAPWSSAGGHLYLTDLEHGGVTGRPLTYVVGLDSDRFPGGKLVDPILLDGDRRALSGDLPTSTDRLDERQFQLAALLGRLRGTVTLSYAAWSPAEAREISPAAVLLDALRLGRRQAELTFEDLHRQLRPLAGPVPRGPGTLDGRDAWLRVLEREGRLLAGRPLVRALYPRLDAGLRGHEAILEEAGNPHHGVLRPRADLDPRRNASRTLSASALEGLGACPRRYFLRRILVLKPPDDPVRDPDRWLDALERGNLLHAVYERILRRRTEVPEIDAETLEAEAMEILAAEAEEKLREIPTPSHAVMRREVADLREDLRSFLGLARSAPSPLALEFKFGLGQDDPVAIDVPGGTVLMRGAVDRIDDREEGLVIVDYKTGRPRRFGGDSGAFDGGRRLQHVVYTKAVEMLLGRRVVAVEYHFPSRRGENAVHRYERAAYASGEELIARLLDGVAAGRFVPTEDVEDCWYCDFRSICRIPEGTTAADPPPLIRWASDRWLQGEEYEAVRVARQWEEE